MIRLTVLLIVLITNTYYQPLQCAEIELWDGSIQKGELNYRRGAYGIKKDNIHSKIDLSKVFEVRYSSKANDTSEFERITLIDGSKINGKIGTSSDFESVPVTLANGMEMEIPGQHIQHIEFQTLDPGAKIVGIPPGPHCISKNGKTILCKIEWISRFDISIKTRAGRMKLSRDKIHLVGFARKATDQKKSKVNVSIKTRFNDEFYGQLILIDEKGLQLEHLLGRLSLRMSDIISIRTISENVVSLCEIEAADVKQDAYFDYIKPMQIDKNLFGGPLVLDGVRFDRGISMHSKTSASFNINGNFKRFIVQIGIDRTLTDLGQAEFKIIGDGKTLSSAVRKGTDDSKIISINVTGINTVTLIVDYDKAGSSGDHAIWGDPRLIR